MSSVSILSVLLTFLLTSISIADEREVNGSHPTPYLDFSIEKAFPDSAFRETSFRVAKVMKNGPNATSISGQSLKERIVISDFIAKSEDAETKGEPEHAVSTPQPLRLGIKEFIALVREKNERIGFQKLEWEIKHEGVKSERSIFEPELVSTYQHEKNRVRNTVEETIARSSIVTGQADIYDERNNDYDIALEELVPTGGRLRLGYNLRDISNSLSDLDQYRTFFGINMTQPLLKSGGIKATMANIRIAEADYDVTFQLYRQEMLEVISAAASAYWDLYFAQERYRVRQESVRIAEQILKNNREGVKTGKIAETELLEAEAGLALRKSLESSAKQDLVSVVNSVRTYFSSSAGEDVVTIEAAEHLEKDSFEPDFSESLKRAFKLRPEYLSTRKKIEREGIAIAYAKNQRWPQLDLKASYGINGLDDSVGNSWDDAVGEDFESWAVGIELRIPLGGGKKTRSKLEAAKRRKKQTLLEIKAIEVALANAVDTAIRNVYSAEEQVKHYGRAGDLNKKLLSVELARFEAGKSNSRLVLEREEILNRAIEDYLEGLSNQKKAVLGLETAEGSLLLSHDIEIMEVEK